MSDLKTAAGRRARAEEPDAPARGGTADEKTPLVTRNRSGCSYSCHTSDELASEVSGAGIDVVEGYDGPFLAELGRVWEISYPMVLSSLSSYLQAVICLIILSNFTGPTGLAGASLGTVFSNICGRSLLIGLSEAIDTLCSQASGAKLYKEMGLTLYRMLIILFIAATAANVLFWHATDLLLLCGQEKQLAIIAGGYVTRQIPGLYALAVQVCLSRFLSAQGVTQPAFWVGVSMLPVSVVTTWIFVHILQLGVNGASYAWTLNMFISAAVWVILTSWVEGSKDDGERAIGKFRCKESFQGWGKILAISLPAYAMMAMEWWTFELLTIFAGLLPDPEIKVVVQVTCMQVMGLMFMFAIGVSVAVSMRVGSALGASRPDSVMRTIPAGIGWNMLEGERGEGR